MRFSPKNLSIYRIYKKGYSATIIRLSCFDCALDLPKS